MTCDEAVDAAEVRTVLMVHIYIHTSATVTRLENISSKRTS